MGNPWYATREEVARATDAKETAKVNAQIDRALESASRDIEGLLHRRFYPWTGTRYFDWPSPRYRNPSRLWLDSNEVISVSQLGAGGVTIPSTDYFLRRADDLDEPPFTFIEIDRSKSSAFTAGATSQRAIAVTGVFGYGADSKPAGTLVEDLDTSETGVDVSDSSVIGVGDVIKVDNERMIVTDKSMLTTGQTLQASLTASKGDVTVQVTTGSAYHVDEILLLDSERMLIKDIAGNSLTVERAWDGSVLATHTGSTIFALRTLTVERGALGTSGATHSNGASVTKHVVPGLIKDLCIAEAINRLAQESAKYARVVGAEGAEVGGIGRSLFDLRRDAVRAFGRTARLAAV